MVLRERSYDYKFRYCGHCNTTTDIKEANFFGRYAAGLQHRVICSVGASRAAPRCCSLNATDAVWRAGTGTLLPWCCTGSW